MAPALLVRLRPAGPWRIGPDSGDRARVDAVYHSDSLYSAVSGAFARLGLLEEWLSATARNRSGSEVRLSSCFPFQGASLLPAPQTLWPPPPSTRVRWKSARFVPARLVTGLLSGEAPEEGHWEIDPAGECLLPSGEREPFRTAVRSGAAVDRLSGAAHWHPVACTEFRPGAGLWTVAGFADEAARNRWSAPLKGAFRLLADSGFGGERSRGWGRAQEPEFSEGTLPELLLPVPAGEPAPAPSAYWLLSLFTPAPEDAIDWSRGSYQLLTRGGRVEGAGVLKKEVRMVAEGSVLVSAAAPRGAAPDVAPDGFAHPVFRAGFALALRLPAVARP
ncbi:MAG: hypothetical protein FJW37_03965 [Acidobacteria bacterium]|nr:hypothetical protein [Acidobacteriota bacterium]